MRLSGPTAALAMLLLVGGCGEDPGTGSRGAPGPSDPETTAAETCAQGLDLDEADRLAGEPMRDPEERQFFSMSSCRWTAAEGDTWIQAIDVPAGRWATVLPDAIEGAMKSDLEFEGRDKVEAALELLELGKAVDDATACDLFTTMVVSLRGLPTGSTEILNYVPSREHIRAINAQQCRDGRYRSVQLAASGMEPSAELEDRIKQAMIALAD